jgi:predicted pyridoxine 5'-phosphate oxidase superfamily flavin-nucleotide-binding protein
MSWKDNFKEGKEIIVSTCSKNGIPNASIAISLGLSKDELLIANVSMKTTIENLKNVKRIVVVGGYFRIKGTAKIFTKGRYFDMCSKILRRQDMSLNMKSAIIVKIKKVFDMENIRPIIYN